MEINRDDLKHGVKKGQRGTVIDILQGGKAYTIEFVDENGETIEEALFTEYAEKDLKRLL